MYFIDFRFSYLTNLILVKRAQNIYYYFSIVNNSSDAKYLFALNKQAKIA